jgi:very-short-patch-repair endonuclease
MGGVMATSEIPPRNGEGDHAKRGGGGVQSLRKPTTYAARKLRKDMSLPEVLLWQELRGAKIGVKFRRQHPVGPYVADFYCAATKLIIEIDGEDHNRGDRPLRDVARDSKLTQLGYRVLRIAALDVLKDLEAVVQTISAETAGPLHRASAVPLPASGEDL